MEQYKQEIYVILLPVDDFDDGRTIIEQNHFNLSIANKVYRSENEFHLKADYVKHIEENVNFKIKSDYIIEIDEFQDMYNDEMVVGSDTWFGYGVVDYRYERD